MNEITQYEVPKRVVVSDHGYPKEDPHTSSRSQAVQVIRGKTFRVSVLTEMHQLRDDRDSFQEDCKRDKHLKSEEELTPATRMEEHRQNCAQNDENRPLEILLFDTFVDGIFV